MAFSTSTSCFCGASCTPPSLMRCSPARGRRVVAAAASATYVSEAGACGLFSGVTSAAREMQQQQIQLSVRRLSRRSVAVSPLAAVLPPASTSVVVVSRALPSAPCFSSTRLAAAAAHDAVGVASRFEQQPLENVFNSFRCPRQVHAVEASSSPAVPLGSHDVGKRRTLLTRGGRGSGEMNVLGAATRTPLLPSPRCFPQVKLAERTVATCCPSPTSAPMPAAAESSASLLARPPDNVDVLLSRQFSLARWFSLYNKLWSVEASHLQSGSCSTAEGRSIGFPGVGDDAAGRCDVPETTAAAAAPTWWRTVSAAALERSAVAAGVAGGAAAVVGEGRRTVFTSGVPAAALHSADGSALSSASALACGEEGTKQGDFAWKTPFFFSSNVLLLLPRRRSFTSAAAAAAAQSVAAAHQTTQLQQQEQGLLHGVKIPPLGDSVTRGSVLEWRKKVGDPVQLDEVLCVIETDKVTVEIHSDCEGVVVAHAAAEGESLNVGDQLALIRVTDPAAADVPFTAAAAQSPPPQEPTQQQQHHPPQQQHSQSTQQQQHSQSTQQQQHSQSTQQQQQQSQSTQQQQKSQSTPQQHQQVQSTQHQQDQSMQQQQSQQGERQTPGDTARQQLGEGATGGLPAASEEVAVTPQRFGETAGAARGESESRRTAERSDDKREAAAGGNSEKPQDRRRHVPLISFGKRRKATVADQETHTKVTGDPAAAAGGRREVQQQGQSNEAATAAAAADADAAQDEDPLMELWGVPRWRPLSEEEIEAVNLGGAGAGANALGAWKAAVVQTQEKPLQKKQQKTKPIQQKAS